MKLKSYVWGMILLDLILLIAFYLVADNVDPTKSGAAGKALFYLILFFFLSGLFNLLLLLTRRAFLGGELAVHDQRAVPDGGGSGVGMGAGEGGFSGTGFGESHAAG